MDNHDVTIFVQSSVGCVQVLQRELEYAEAQAARFAEGTAAQPQRDVAQRRYAQLMESIGASPSCYKTLITTPPPTTYPARPDRRGQGVEEAVRSCSPAMHQASECSAISSCSHHLQGFH